MVAKSALGIEETDNEIYRLNGAPQLGHFVFVTSTRVPQYWQGTLTISFTIIQKNK
jgi:hypothetical protein